MGIASRTADAEREGLSWSMKFFSLRDKEMQMLMGGLWGEQWEAATGLCAGEGALLCFVPWLQKVGAGRSALCN